MKKGLIITGSIVAVSAIAYIIYRKSVPPRLTVRTFSPVTMEGTFEWGKSAGSLEGSGGFSAGWGWEAKLTSDPNKKQYRMDITKDGRPYSSINIVDAGIYKI